MKEHRFKEMKNMSLIITKYESGWIEYITSLDKADFELYTRKKSKSSIMGKFRNLTESFEFLVYLLKNRKKINDYQSLILVGNNYAIVGLVLNKLQILKNKKIVWWGFYLHSTPMMHFYKAFKYLVESKKTVYVLFSEFEQNLYKNVFSKKVTIMSLPYGSWNDSIIEQNEQLDYYFAGGYSNRDYLPLIEAFKGSKYKLIIIASKLNKYLDGISVPANIELLKDVSKEVFHQKMTHARGVIIPLKNNLGASGQMVMLNALARKKVVIINNNDIMKEYIIDKESGLVVDNIERDLMGVIDALEENPEYKKRLEEMGFKRYIECFSKEPCKIKTLEIINRIQA